MNTFQRALRSVTRKPIKSALLLLVIVTVSLLLLCGMACQNASIQTQDSTRQAVGQDCVWMQTKPTVLNGWMNV